VLTWCTTDHVANIKRKLQLLLPGVAIVLDVDDLEDVGEIEQYVKVSQSVLLFLSNGSFLAPLAFAILILSSRITFRAFSCTRAM
jgi:hypothetical protein